MYVLQLAKLSGANATIAIGRNEEIADGTAKIWSRCNSENITKEKLRDSIKHNTSGKGIDVIFDFVAITESIESSIKVLTNSGKLILVGVGNGQTAVNPKALTMK